MHHLDIRDWDSIRLRIGESTRRTTNLDPEQSSHPSSNPPSSQFVGINRESKEVGVQMPTKTTTTLMLTLTLEGGIRPTPLESTESD